MSTSIPRFNSSRIFLWGFVKDKVYFPYLLANIYDLRARFAGAVAEITPDMLRRTWEDIYYMWDICYATSEGHIEM
jgi:hypothetical protein